MRTTRRRRLWAACTALALSGTSALASDDNYFDQQWDLTQLGAPDAWSRSTGSGVVDGGSTSAVRTWPARSTPWPTASAARARRAVPEYLTKPVRRSELHDCLATVMGAPPVATAAQRPVGAVLRPAPPGSSGRILLVEDNEVNQLVATAMLEKLGFDVDVAANGLDAVRVAALTPYEAILMDCQMPILDGYAATQEIRRAQDGARRTPIVGVTASALKSDPQRCLEAGMDDYLSKPITLGTLTAMIDRWVPVSAR